MRRVVLALLLAAPAADAAIFVVRHAERASAKDDASLLSAEGKRRASELRRVLSGVELKAVYCTEYERTRQTAQPAAEGRGLKPVIVHSEKGGELAEALRLRPAEEDVLVVGHTDTIPDLLKALGVETPVSIASDEYDNLFIVTLREGKAPGFHRLRFGGQASSPKRR